MFNKFKMNSLSSLIAIGGITLSGCVAPQAQNQAQTQRQAQNATQNRHYQDVPKGYADSEIKPNHHSAVAQNTPRYYQFDKNGTPISVPANRYVLPAYDKTPQRHNPVQTRRADYQGDVNYNTVQNYTMPHSAATQQTRPSYYRAASVQTAGYRVRAGDTVYSLAKSYCSSVTDIARANGLGRDYAIQAEQYLTIPQTRC